MNIDEVFWVAHELFHVEQYQEWEGIEKFAYVYINYPGPNGWLERQADLKGELVVSEFGYDKTYAKLLAVASINDQSKGQQCEYKGLKRRVVVEYWGNSPGSAPCTLGYFKDVESPGTKKILWQAMNDTAFCDRKASMFVDRLESMGWQCNN